MQSVHLAVVTELGWCRVVLLSVPPNTLTLPPWLDLQVEFNAANNIIVDNINIPCKAVTKSGRNVDGTSCGMNEIYGWPELAEEIVKSRNIDLRKYKNKIIVMPPNKCGFGGLAEVGCGDSCYTWIKVCIPVAAQHNTTQLYGKAHCNITASVMPAAWNTALLRLLLSKLYNAQ